MANRLKFPIRYKILVAVSTVVIAAIAFYLYLASRIFYDDKTLLVYELNQSNVRNLSADVESNIKRTLDKLHLVAALTLFSGSGNIAALNQVSESEDTLVSATILRVKAGRKIEPRDGKATDVAEPETEIVFTKRWTKYLQAYGQDIDYLNFVRQQFPIPVSRVLKDGVWVRNSTMPPGNHFEGNNPPLVTVATALQVTSDNKGPVSYILVADARSDQIIDSFTQAGISKAYAVDSESRVLAHPEMEKVASQTDFSADPIIAKSLGSKVRSQVVQFREGDVTYLGAFYQTGLAGVVVASRTELGEAFAAARVLLKKSFLYAAIVITAAFLLVLFLSHTLTEPIAKMVEATRRIAAGDFANLVPASTRDELAVLAQSFNVMTVNLKESREKIEEYNRELENKVAERTKQLEEKNVAIKEAQEALVRTTRLASVGEIAGRAAHEVLNPLTSMMARLEKVRNQALAGDGQNIKLFGEIIKAWLSDFTKGGTEGFVKSVSVASTVYPGKTLLEEDLQNLIKILTEFDSRHGEQREDVDFLLKEAGRISKIVNGMRQLTRVSASRRANSINKVLDETAATMADYLGKKKIKIETRLCDGAPEVVSDHDELLQVFTNLVRNSSQAIEEAIREGKPVGAEPLIWLSTERVPIEGRSYVLVRVGDNGPGIPRDKFEMVFEPTYTTKTASEGTGLGLSIARRFIRASEGEIMVEKSIPGEQTVFLIQLPENSRSETQGANA